MTTETALATMTSRDAWQVLREEATTLHKSGFLPAHIKNPEQAIAIAMVGRELGITPWRALTGIKVIQQTPTLSAELMAQLIYQQHGSNALDIEETTAESCTISYQRRGAKERRRYTFTMQMAMDAGLGSNQNYKKHPANMLRARCISNIARMAFPDTIAGCYSEDEGEEIARNGHPQISDVTEETKEPIPLGDYARSQQQLAASPAPSKELLELRGRVVAALDADHESERIRRSMKTEPRDMTEEQCQTALTYFAGRARTNEQAQADQAQQAAIEGEVVAPETPAADATESQERRSKLSQYVDGVQAIFDAMMGTRGALTAEQVAALGTVYEQGQLLMTSVVGTRASEVKPTELAGLIGKLRDLAVDELRAGDAPTDDDDQEAF